MWWRENRKGMGPLWNCQTATLWYNEHLDMFCDVIKFFLLQKAKGLWLIIMLCGSVPPLEEFIIDSWKWYDNSDNFNKR